MARGGGGHGRNQFLTEEEKANKPKLSWGLIKRIFSYLKPYTLQMILVIVAITISSALSILPSILTGRIIDDGLIGGDYAMLLRLVAISFGVLIASNMISVLNNYLNTWVAQHITYDMKNSMYAHMQQMSQRFFASSRQGEIITRMTSDIDGVQRVISGTLVNALQNISLVVIALVAMFQKNVPLAILGVILVPFFIIPTKKVGKKRWMITRQAQEKNDEINTILNETLSVSGQLLVKLFTKEVHEYNNYKNVNAQMTKLNIKESMAGRWFGFTMNVFTNIGPMLIYLLGGYLILIQGDSGLTVGDITVMVALIGKLYFPVNSLLNLQVDAIRSLALFTRLFEYYDMEIEVKNPENPIFPLSVDGNISFEDVSFYYEKEKPVLNNVSFSLEKGRSVAIVGASGAGKSTITSLISRLYDVTGGSIKIDGNDIRDLDLTFLRQNIGTVSQETYLFNGSIRDNLLYADPDATDDEIIEACKKANIHDFIESLPNKYDTVIGNRGIKLSGGEKQRVSIARAMLKDPKVLILDEATSSLDSISESLIQDAIEPLLSGRTSIVIAHRLSTIMSAHEILVLDKGQIAERGSHRDLLEKGGIYKELYETQFKKAIEDQLQIVEELKAQVAMK